MATTSPGSGRPCSSVPGAGCSTAVASARSEELSLKAPRRGGKRLSGEGFSRVEGIAHGLAGEDQQAQHHRHHEEAAQSEPGGLDVVLALGQQFAQRGRAGGQAEAEEVERGQGASALPGDEPGRGEARWRVRESALVALGLLAEFEAEAGEMLRGDFDDDVLQRGDPRLEVEFLGRLISSKLSRLRAHPRATTDQA